MGTSIHIYPPSAPPLHTLMFFITHTVCVIIGLQEKSNQKKMVACIMEMVSLLAVFYNFLPCGGLRGNDVGLATSCLRWPLLMFFTLLFWVGLVFVYFRLVVLRSVIQILAFLLMIFFFTLKLPCMYTMWYFFVSQGFPMFLVWQHPSNHVTLFLFQLQVFVLLCFVSIFSVWRCPWAVLRPDEAFWGGGFPAKHTLSIFGRLCGSRLFQYWGECYSVMITRYVK